MDIVPEGGPAFAGDLAGGLLDDGSIEPLEDEVEQGIGERHDLARYVLERGA